MEGGGWRGGGLEGVWVLGRGGVGGVGWFVSLPRGPHPLSYTRPSFIIPLTRAQQHAHNNTHYFTMNSSAEKISVRNINCTLRFDVQSILARALSGQAALLGSNQSENEASVVRADSCWCCHGIKYSPSHVPALITEPPRCRQKNNTAASSISFLSCLWP